jgi:hypothetical protein
VNTVILNWQRPLWEEDQEVVKSSGRKEPMWVAIHKCMEATVGIFLYPKLAIMVYLSYYLLGFSSTKSEKRAEEVLPGIGGLRGWGWGGGGTSNVYTCA